MHMRTELVIIYLTSTEVRLLIRDGEERVKARPRAPTRKTKDAVDRRQNNKNVKGLVKAVFVRNGTLKIDPIMKV